MDIKPEITIKSYPAKLLLFGEYTILNGSAAYAIPFTKFYGRWDYGQKHFDFTDLENHIVEVCKNNKDLVFNRDLWQSFFRHNGYYKSTIPYGYGLGSSGSLSAAIYDQFISYDHKDDLFTVKLHLSQLEDFFHGNSSGVDPMISFTGQSMIFSKEDLIVKSVEDILVSDLFLYNSNTGRVASNYIKIFKEKMLNSNFKSSINHLTEINHSLIFKDFDFETYIALSELQYSIFQEFIPLEIKRLWKKGLEEKNYFFKLCGAGGGGYFIVKGDVTSLNSENILKVEKN